MIGQAPGNSLGPPILEHPGVAGTALSTFYTLGPHRAEGGMDINHLLQRNTEAQRGEGTRPTPHSQKVPEPGFETPGDVGPYSPCSMLPATLRMNE